MLEAVDDKEGMSVGSVLSRGEYDSRRSHDDGGRRGGKRQLHCCRLLGTEAMGSGGRACFQCNSGSCEAAWYLCTALKIYILHVVHVGKIEPLRVQTFQPQSPYNLYVCMINRYSCIISCDYGCRK